MSKYNISLKTLLQDSLCEHEFYANLWQLSLYKLEQIMAILNIHSPMKRNHSLLEYNRDNGTQVSE